MVFNNAINQNVTGLVFSVGNGTYQGKNISVTTQVFTASGTYTKPTGLLSCIVECVGGGAGGGGCAAANNNEVANASGGGAGGYCRKTFQDSELSATVTVTIGSGGNGGVAGNNNGTNGGNTSFDTLLIANGGTNGFGAASGFFVFSGGVGGTATGGDINCNGGYGGDGFFSTHSTVYAGISGSGGSSFFGSDADGRVTIGSSAPGTNATVYGSGGSGACSSSGGSAQAGGNGAAGVCIITNYILS